MDDVKNLGVATVIGLAVLLLMCGGVGGAKAPKE
jgi:hypothetical protein